MFKLIVGISKFFYIIAHHCFSFLHNYFHPIKLFSDLYLAKFLDISTKSFFSVYSDGNEKHMTRTAKTMINPSEKLLSNFIGASSLSKTKSLSAPGISIG